MLGFAATAAGQSAPPKPKLTAERALAASVNEARMTDAVRRLVALGPRMYGTPSNHAAAAWLSIAFREAGLKVDIRKDTPRAWYQPVKWEVRAGGAGAPGNLLETAWPSSGSPSAKGDAELSLGAAPGAVCLVSASPTPENTAGCVAVLFDGRASPSGWPTPGRLRGTWTIPVFNLGPKDTAPLRELLGSGGHIRASFALDAVTGTDNASTVVATLPGRDHTKYILFCAHGDADSGGPGANDNASGVAIVLEIARAMATAVKAGRVPQPAWDIRFVSWGGEIASTREYVAAMAEDKAQLQAVFNFDQSGFGSAKEALYVEPDDIAVNKELVTLVRTVMTDHLGGKGFPEHAASVKSQGGTDSYVFQNTRTPGATLYPSITLYTSAWDRERTVPITEGFPPINWYPGEQPGMITVDGDPFYHSAGDTPANTTDAEPSNMGWCARVGLLSALRLMAGR
jgi:hypothetical protein